VETTRNVTLPGTSRCETSQGTSVWPRGRQPRWHPAWPARQNSNPLFAINRLPATIETQVLLNSSLFDRCDDVNQRDMGSLCGSETRNRLTFSTLPITGRKRFVAIALMLLGFCSLGGAQTSGSAPASVGIQPFGTYTTGFDNIGLSDLSVHIDIPLFTHKARGATAGTSFTCTMTP
jgi:hypothetical protein